MGPKLNPMVSTHQKQKHPLLVDFSGENSKSSSSTWTLRRLQPPVRLGLETQLTELRFRGSSRLRSSPGLLQGIHHLEVSLRGGYCWLPRWMRSKTQGERTRHTCQYDCFLSVTLVTSFTQTHAYQMYRMCKESGGKNRQHLILDRTRCDQMIFCHFKIACRVLSSRSFVLLVVLWKGPKAHLSLWHTVASHNLSRWPMALNSFAVLADDWLLQQLDHLPQDLLMLQHLAFDTPEQRSGTTLTNGSKDDILPHFVIDPASVWIHGEDLKVPKSPTKRIVLYIYNILCRTTIFEAWRSGLKFPLARASSSWNLRRTYFKAANRQEPSGLSF